MKTAPSSFAREERFMNDIQAWYHDDICWCANDCDYFDCCRNIINRKQKDGYYTAAYLKGTPMCSQYTNYVKEDDNRHDTDGKI